MTISPEMLTSIISLIGTAVGSISGILISNRLTVYRIEQLEKKVDKHNTVVERMALAERDIKTVWSQIDELHSDVANLENKMEEKHR